jgi:CheY-like chemotaxis protein
MLNNMTILYVEDDKDTQEVISAILGTIFKEVFTASNGREGIEVYKNSNPDIILTDIGMPIMDGINMSVEIKKINKNQHIIALTAFF